MSALRHHAEDYLLVRRALGYKLRGEGLLLASFVGYLEQAGASTVTTNAAVQWTKLATTAASPAYLARRMRVARGFARYLAAFDPSTEVPPQDLFPCSKYRPTPYIYTEAETLALMAAARSLQPPLRAATYEALIGLLASTGLRISEATALDRDDVHWRDSSLVVRESKYNKSREVLLHKSTLVALRRYGATRVQALPDALWRRASSSPPGAPACFTSRSTRASGRSCAKLASATSQGRAGQSCTVSATASRSYTLRDWLADGGDIAARLPALSTYLGHGEPKATYWYFTAVPELLVLAAGTPRGRFRGPRMSELAPTLERYFTERLIAQKGASAHTISAYADTFRLLLAFAQERTGKAPSALDFYDIDVPLIGAFLDHLEHGRHNACVPATRGLPPCTRFSASQPSWHPSTPALSAGCSPSPLNARSAPTCASLSPKEIAAILAVPDRDRWVGRRDHALLLFAVQTGLRVSELTGLCCGDVELGRGPDVRCEGKGRKQRCTPLIAQTVAVLRAWLVERQGGPDEPLFPTSTGRRLSRDAVVLVLAKYAQSGSATLPVAEAEIRYSPHLAPQLRNGPPP